MMISCFCDPVEVIPQQPQKHLQTTTTDHPRHSLMGLTRKICLIFSADGQPVDGLAIPGERRGFLRANPGIFEADNAGILAFGSG
jgi:hypothetical protein